MTHGVINHHPNIVLSNTLYALCTSTILILLWRHRGIYFWQLFVPGILLGVLMVAVDVLRTCCLRRDRIHTGCTIPASPVAFACPVAEHPGGLPVVACLLRS